MQHCSNHILTIKMSFTDFRCCSSSTNNTERSVQPIEVGTPEHSRKIHKVVLTDRGEKVLEIVDATDILYDNVVSILTNQLR